MTKIKITPKQLMMELMPSLNEQKSSKKSARISYAFVKTFDKCQQIIKHYDAARLEILDRLCKRDKEGKPEVDKNKNYVFESEDVKKQIEEEINKLAEMEEELDVHSISFDEVADMEINDFSLEMLLKHKVILEPAEKIQTLKPV